MSIRFPSSLSSSSYIYAVLSALVFFASCTSATTPTSFCKCTCFNTNSTIIPLTPPSDGNPGAAATTCADCNRSFCLEYRLPICKGAREEDIFTTCFQRDSRKDEAFVFIFIFATAGLLLWALLRPWVGNWVQAAKERSRYVPVEAEGDS
ncbi:hypothetical protein L228DRAFT_247305 [Xylona heveae TC161]|uniref:Uncharacterized protein n=1 Tax=Xylona heveae (strain CBS 132557 / TC161) TaxID=1328760 RepID=A0A165H2B5_XYLHT|nr:hypothetical protein L228DRAFT_247305 [Xylona heveae TC161]KZF22891.1 hypothetical protein L228DRAFT_247305 [Xylona heveae TC161]